MKTLSLIPYTHNSEVCLKLRQVLPKFKYNKPAEVILNFGSTQKFNMKCKFYINHPMNVNVAVDKLKTFEKLKGKVSIPRFTTDRGTARTFSLPVFVRTTLKGSQGKGIVVAERYDDIIKAPLFVEGIKGTREYRIIMFNDKVVTVMQKVAKVNAKDEYIKNLANGYRYKYDVYSNVDTLVCETLARKTLKLLGLQFGAVDIVFAEGFDAYVLEVNTAFGLGENNLNKFKKVIEKYVQNLNFLDESITIFKNVIWFVKNNRLLTNH